MNAVRKNITDRALRYRAQKNAPELPRVCCLCGSTKNVEVDHIDGHEEHGEADNLMWACRPCNTAKGYAMKKAGIGRLTYQYNPANKGAKTLGQWLQAVGAITPHVDRGDRGLVSDMQVKDAVAMIRATPASKRREFASKLRRKNPAEGAVEAYEDFHGRPPAEMVTFQTKVHYHKHLAGAGELRAMSVIPYRGTVPIKMSGFKGALLAFNEKRNQLFVAGGDQSVDPKVFGIRTEHEVQTLGKVRSIDYHTTKDHLGDEGGTATYGHKFRTVNENGKHVTVKIATYPDLIYYVRDKQLVFSGGDYQILTEGINR